VSIARFDFGLVLIVRVDMSVRNGVSVVRIRLMDVLGRDGDRAHHRGRKRENEGKMPDGAHDQAIMVGWSSAVKLTTCRAADFCARFQSFRFRKKNDADACFQQFRK
jgi:hypothetical protein